MKEILLTDIERLFDNLLNDVATGRRTPEECLSLCQQRHPELVSSLKFAFSLRSVSPDLTELETARMNTWHTITAVLDRQNETPIETHPDIRVTPSRPMSKRHSRWRVAALSAAIVAIAFMGNWMLSSVTADALPGSPFYTLKRADENVQLQMAWSSQMRGEVLSQIALHRLAEAREEADLQNISQALALVDESNAATHQLIALAILLQSQHQNSDAVTQALATTMQAEYDALQQARNDGQIALAQALSASYADQQSTLSASKVVLPPLANPPTSVPTTAANPTRGAHPTPPPHPTHIPHETPTTKPTPNGNGNGSGSGNGSDSGRNTGGNE